MVLHLPIHFSKKHDFVFVYCMLAMFGFLPSGVDDSLTNLIIYNAFPIEIKFSSNRAMQATWANVKYYLVNFIKYVVILGMYSSILLAYDYHPYPNVEGPALLDIRILHGFSRGQLINNLSIAGKHHQFVSMPQ